MLHVVTAGVHRGSAGVLPWRAFVVLMQWAGYVEATDGLSPNQALALKYLGDDVSEEELEAIRAALDVLPTVSPHSSLGGLTPAEYAERWAINQPEPS